MVIFNLKILNNMKKIYKLFALLPIIAAFIMTACSNDEDIAQNNAAFEEYNFKVNAYIADATRATGDTALKTDWEHKNVIYCIVDDDVDNILTLTYDTLARTWDTKALNNAPAFNASGSLKAVYADVLSYDATKGIRTKGDIITTENGSYTKDGNVIMITLPMDTRPVMKLTILGVPDAYPCIKDFHECSYLDFSTMTYTDEGKYGLSNREQAMTYTTSSTGSISSKKIAGAYNYYGYFDSSVTDNFTLATEDMTSFWINNTHASASMNKGTQYIIKGPSIAEALSEWTPNVQVIPVVKSNAMSISAGSVVRMDSLFTYKYGNPSGAAYSVTSSNSTVITPTSESEGKTWTVKAIENEDDRGSSQVTITTENASAVFNMTVEERITVNGVLGMSFKVDSIIKRIVLDNPTNAFSYCANEFFDGSAITYTSGDETLATISSGIVNMNTAGVVIITATNTSNNLQFSFKINIQDISKYVTVTWGTAAYKTEVASSHGAGVMYTFTNGLGKNVYGMELSGTTLSDVKDMTVTSIQVTYATGTKSEEVSISTFFQIGSEYSPKSKNVVAAGYKGTGYYDLGGSTDLSWHKNSKAEITFSYNGKTYSISADSGNADVQ